MAKTDASEDADATHLVTLGAYAALTFSSAVLAWVVARWLKQSSRYRPSFRKKGGAIATVEVVANVCAWYGTSVTLTLFNKWFLTFYRGDGFAFPMTATAGHMVIKATLSRALLRGRCSPWRVAIDPLELPVLFRVIVPIGVSTALDIMLSNLSFRFVTVSFYTIIKAGSLLWILLWALVLGLEQFSLTLVGVCVVVSLGLACASYAETAFSTFGLVVLLGASCCAGIRWALVQKLVASDDAFHSPLLVLYHMAPWSAVSTIVLSLLLEGRQLLHQMGSSHEDSGWVLAAEAVGFTCFGGVVSFFLIIVEVQLLQLTSSITLGVFGTVKELVQIVLAILVFSDVVTPTKGLGLFLSIAGTFGYQQLKARERKNSPDHMHEYDLVSQADVELEAFGDLQNSDEELSDGWDDMALDAGEGEEEAEWGVIPSAMEQAGGTAAR